MPQPRTRHSEPFTSCPHLPPNGDTGRSAPAIGDATHRAGRGAESRRAERRTAQIADVDAPSAMEQARGRIPRSPRSTRLTASRPLAGSEPARRGNGQERSVCRGVCRPAARLQWCVDHAGRGTHHRWRIGATPGPGSRTVRQVRDRGSRTVGCLMVSGRNAVPRPGGGRDDPGAQRQQRGDRTAAPDAEPTPDGTRYSSSPASRSNMRVRTTTGGGTPTLGVGQETTHDRSRYSGPPASPSNMRIRTTTARRNADARRGSGGHHSRRACAD